MDLYDNTKLTLIDYEYAGWNPMAYDLANYLNECSIDNCHPSKNGIAAVNNEMTDQERADFLTHYLKLVYLASEQKASWEEYIAEALPVFDREVKQCRLLNHFMWAIWAFSTLSDQIVCSEDVFNYAYADIRIKQFR